MEGITVAFIDTEFDAAVHAQDALPEGMDIKFCVKRKATQSGQPGVCITWSVQLPSGVQATCQAVTTWVALRAAVRAIEAGLDNNFSGIPPAHPQTINKEDQITPLAKAAAEPDRSQCAPDSD